MRPPKAVGAVEVSGVAATVAISRVVVTMVVAVEVDLVVAVEDARFSRRRATLQKVATFMHACEGDTVTKLTNDWNEAYSLFQCSYLSEKHDSDWEK
ncbi:hypothetical protein ACSQ67_009933 [Phaseolus vulgaris]